MPCALCPSFWNSLRIRVSNMGCVLSSPRDASPLRAGSIGEVAVFVPGFRIPKTVDLTQQLGDFLSKSLLDRFSALRTRIVSMASVEAKQFAKPMRRRTTTRHGSALSELLRAVEDYLPILLGLVNDGSQLTDKVKFIWINLEDEAEETAITNAWYEVLSVLHLMAMLSLFQANLLLLPKMSHEGYQLKIPEERRKTSIDILLKAAGYLDSAIRHALPRIPPEYRKELPVDLEERVLRALCLQALGQCVDIQLGMAIDSTKATLAVKRRLACEMMSYWHQAHGNIGMLCFDNGWGKKHQLFVKWKYAEAKAAAYYYHGLILDEGNTEKSHGMAAAALQTAEEVLTESKKSCEDFHVMPPTSRNPPLWGSMKYLSEKIPKDASNKIRINRDLYSEERNLKSAPSLPDFALALVPDDYQLPPLDPLWSQEDYHDRKLVKEKHED
ncbi:uncharacterized protein LOC122046963 isoform X5 [Zingiber officinale]|uniref:uncharacterized protein LOC122046963 isoform X5 n=1 Tax=Zingiber officinale TaxID=94328 RepID=UPI001C4C39BB|nr:uncharacterized protein LOC122046963 isoform X5 [Zingiber officinale]